MEFLEVAPVMSPHKSLKNGLRRLIQLFIAGGAGESSRGRQKVDRYINAGSLINCLAVDQFTPLSFSGRTAALYAACRGSIPRGGSRTFRY